MISNFNLNFIKLFQILILHAHKTKLLFYEYNTGAPNLILLPKIAVISRSPYFVFNASSSNWFRILEKLICLLVSSILLVWIALSFSKRASSINIVTCFAELTCTKAIFNKGVRTVHVLGSHIQGLSIAWRHICILYNIHIS